MTANVSDKIWQSIEKLDKWLTANGWEGYDPYDLRGTPAFLKVSQIKFLNIPQKGLFFLESAAPRLLRKLFFVQKRINAKAMGLFADSYLDLYKITGKTSFWDKAQETIQWLETNYSRQYSGKSWGYPFNWQSNVLIPAGTPSSVVTATIGNAFWNFYKYTGAENYLTTCTDICDFFEENLNIYQSGNDRICFSYTPLDDFQVHNANLFVAEFLIRVGREVGNDQWIELGRKALNFTLSEQNEDGSICYWGKEQSKSCHMDHYHSGFEIQSLYSIWKLTDEQKIYRAVKRYYEFYLHHFFEAKTIPKFRPTQTYPINIHACAESILCNATLSTDFPEGNDYLKNEALWTISNMQDRMGYFYYKIQKYGWIKRKIKIPYLRWGQAWMLRGLTQVAVKNAGK